MVIDLARKIPYTVEQIGDELRVLFRRAVETAASAVAPAAPVAIEEPAVEARRWQMTRRPRLRRSPVAAAGNARACGSPAPPVMAAAVPPAPWRRVPPAVTAPISQAPLPVPMPSALVAAAAQQTWPARCRRQCAKDSASSRATP